MTVLAQISVGRDFSRFALRSARSTASRSWPSTSGITCQPYASKRRRTSSVNHCLIRPLSESIEMPLSS